MKRATFLLVMAFPAAAQPAGLTVAAAANLTGVCAEAAQTFTKKSGIPVVCSYGSTAQLAGQMTNGAPFDLFAAADTAHVDALIGRGKLVAASRAIYAQGQLALWAPKAAIRDLADLTLARVRFVAIAKPELAPYGQASMEALQSAGIWAQVQPKLVYPSSIQQAKQMAASGNADAAFTALSLVLNESGTVIRIDQKLYKPIDQALGISASTPHMREARQFHAFLLGEQGRAILRRNGYLLPR